MKGKAKKIIGIDIVCAQGADTFNVGQKGIETIISDLIQTGSDSAVTFYFCYDKNGKKLFEISANTPIIIKCE